MRRRFIQLGALACVLAACTADTSVRTQSSSSTGQDSPSTSTTPESRQATGDLQDTLDGQVGGVDLGPGQWPLELEFLSDVNDGRPWLSGEPGPPEDVATTAITDILTAWSGDQTNFVLANGVPVPAAADLSTSTFGADGAILGLIPVAQPADVVAALGWWGAANYDQTPSDMSAVLRSWEDRYGAYVTRLGFASIYISVTRPPQDIETARLLALEHFARCPGLAEFEIPVEGCASGLVEATEWFCWWD